MALVPTVVKIDVPIIPGIYFLVKSLIKIEKNIKRN